MLFHCGQEIVLCQKEIEFGLIIQAVYEKIDIPNQVLNEYIELITFSIGVTYLQDLPHFKR